MYGARPAPSVLRLLARFCWLFWTSAATAWRLSIVLVIVVWLLPIRLARSVATWERLPTTPSRSEFFDASADDTVCRLVTRLSMSPEREASAVSTWSRLPMMEPTWVSRASTVWETAAPLLMSWLICAVSPSSAPDTFSTNWLASVGLIDESTGPSEFKKVSTLASVTSWLNGIVAPDASDRAGVAREQLDLLLADDVLPAHPDVGRLPQRHRVVDAHGDDRVPVLHADARHLPDGHAGDVDVVAAGQPGDVGQLRVDRVAAAEQRDVADLDGEAREEDEADQGEDGELERRGGEVAPEPHDDPPRSWFRIEPSVVGLDVSGWPRIP